MSESKPSNGHQMELKVGISKLVRQKEVPGQISFFLALRKIANKIEHAFGRGRMSYSAIYKIVEVDSTQKLLIVTNRALAPLTGLLLG